MLYGFESLLIIIPCLFYIYELLKSNLLISLKSDANFISTCGLLFYFSISIPTYFSWYTLYYLSPGFDKILTILIIVMLYVTYNFIHESIFMPNTGSATITFLIFMILYIIVMIYIHYNNIIFCSEKTKII